MPFQKPLLGWKASGIEPPISLKERGWEAQQKPPAPYFNWTFYLLDQALTELQQNAIHKDQLGVAGGVARLNAQGKPMNADGTLAGEVSKEEFTAHTGNAGIHVTPQKTAEWDAKETPSGAQAKINAAIAALIDGAPGAIDTLKELAEAMGNDPNFAATMTNALARKVDKVTGKQLSTEDYTTAEKSKLGGIAPGANNYIHPPTHPATMIEQSPTHRMVSDTWINNMNAKETPEGAQAKVNAAIASLINGSPGALDTLNELAEALGDDPNFATTVTNALATKETPAGAKAKADAALAAAKVYAQNAVAIGSTADPNITQESYILTNHANSPGGGLYWHIHTMFYSTVTGNRAQISISYNATGSTRLLTRSYYGTTWTPWVEHTTIAQAQALVDAHANKKDNPHATTAAQVGAYSKTEADGRFETPTGAKSKIDAAIAALIDGAPGAIDTLNELAAALGDDPNFATTVANALATKETPAGAQAKVNEHANLKNNPHAVTALQTPITDAGNYYAGTNTEAALQEIGNVLAGTKTNLAAVAQELIRL